MNWRPDDWEELKSAGAKEWFDKTGSGSFSFPHFELGADAMKRYLTPYLLGDIIPLDMLEALMENTD